MDGICVIRNTFRVDDNILLFKALQNKVNTIYIPIDTRRVLKPTDCVPVVNPSAHTIQNKHYTKYNSGNYYWGYHQYYFLLQAIRSFEEDLRLRFSHINVVVQKQSVSRHISFIKAFGTCYCDRVDDPAWFSFDKALGTQYDKTRLHLYPTQTLLDWQDTEHHSFLAQWSHKRQNQSFKEYVFSQSFDFHTQIHQNECNTTFLNHDRSRRTRSNRHTHLNTHQQSRNCTVASRSMPVPKKRHPHLEKVQHSHFNQRRRHIQKEEPETRPNGTFILKSIHGRI